MASQSTKGHTLKDNNSASASLHTSGLLYLVHSFEAWVPQACKREIFQWKRSSSREVRKLKGEHHDEKPVRVSTGEVVAATTNAQPQMHTSSA
jgi:hypothetical protein